MINEKNSNEKLKIEVPDATIVYTDKNGNKQKAIGNGYSPLQHKLTQIQNFPNFVYLEYSKKFL